LIEETDLMSDPLECQCCPEPGRAASGYRYVERSHRAYLHGPGR
jgi:hypothetical protein